MKNASCPLELSGWLQVSAPAVQHQGRHGQDGHGVQARLVLRVGRVALGEAPAVAVGVQHDVRLVLALERPRCLVEVGRVVPAGRRPDVPHLPGERLALFPYHALAARRSHVPVIPVVARMR